MKTENATETETAVIRIDQATKCRLMKRMSVGESFTEAINALLDKTEERKND